MAESIGPQTPSTLDAAPLGLAAGWPELPRAARAVEQLLDLQRIGTVMAPDHNRPEEAWGVLNPASARSRDGELYLFPRVVADKNYSRIAMARVSFDTAGNPAGVERLQLVLEPQESYEFAGPGTGGVEDPRISYIPLLDSYIMTYTALGPFGARIALAVSRDLHFWSRLGLLHFEVTGGLDLNRCDNKDCVIFPVPVTDPEGRPALALLHRPIYLVPRPDGTTDWQLPPGITDRRPSIWISYVPVDRVEHDIQELMRVSNHQLLAHPIGNWEFHHIGAGAPPILSEEGWLLYYHGVLGAAPNALHATHGDLVYQSGVMLLDRDDPRRVLYRSSKPILLPQEPGEKEGIVSNIVFPTAVDVRGQRIDVYYGAADERIAAATTRITSSVLLAPSAPSGADVRDCLRVSNGLRERSGNGHEGYLAHAGAVSQDDHKKQEGETGMQVKDIMSSAVEVVSRDTTLDEAARRMQVVDVGVLPVQDDDAVIGVVTDRDMTVRAIAQGLDPKTATVGEVMTPEVHYCFDDQSVEEAASTMAESRLRRLVVFDRAMRLTGIVSLDDVATIGENPTLAGETLEQAASRSDRMHGQYERILVALDGSTLAERVLSSIEPLAQKFGSRVTLLRVVSPISAPVMAATVAGAMSVHGPASGAAPTTDGTRREAAGYLSAVQQRLAAQGLTVESEYPEGPASEMILRRARQLGVDLIALTTHGRTGVDRLLLGSVAEDVVRRAPCPVHLVRVHSGH